MNIELVSGTYLVFLTKCHLRTRHTSIVSIIQHEASVAITKSRIRIAGTSFVISVAFFLEAFICYKIVNI